MFKPPWDRTLALSCDALPAWGNEPALAPLRLHGTEVALLRSDRSVLSLHQSILTQDAQVRYPPFPKSVRELDDEIQRARSHAIDLLQHVGIGGTPIDVDSMVAEPSRCYCDYTARPWENDAFFCGETATAYWKSSINPNMALDIHAMDQCSRAYELADAHEKPLARLASASSRDAGKPNTGGGE